MDGVLIDAVLIHAVLIELVLIDDVMEGATRMRYVRRRLPASHRVFNHGLHAAFTSVSSTRSVFPSGRSPRNSTHCVFIAG
jgi:hypothetical protein